MSREIKFRAWDILSKRMMEDIELWLIPYGVLFPHTPDQRCLELMQFTGLLDKNGKEIYEGDVLGLKYFAHWVVICEPGAFHIYNVTDPNKTYPLVQTFEREVIGNIYENPELLEALG